MFSNPLLQHLCTLPHRGLDGLLIILIGLFFATLSVSQPAAQTLYLRDIKDLFILGRVVRGFPQRCLTGVQHARVQARFGQQTQIVGTLHTGPYLRHADQSLLHCADAFGRITPLRLHPAKAYRAVRDTKRQVMLL